MEELSKYDPYTIKQIQFYLQKKTKYATLKSIVVSIVILILTILVSSSELKNIWVSRASLDIFSTNQKKSLETLTQNFICVISKTYFNKTANTTLSNINKFTNFTLQTYSSTVKFNNRKQILDITLGRDFYCYDIQGAIINKDMMLLLTINGQVDVIFKTYSLSQILGQQASNIYSMNLTYLGNRTMYVDLTKIKGIIYDSLLINYDPIKFLGFKNQVKTTSLTVINGYSIQFISQTTKENQLTQQIYIKRRNIGQILGKFFSWLTIFILLFTFFIAPLVQFNFKLNLCKKIYDNKNLQQLQVSAFTFFKYLISIIKKGLFKEQILQEIFERLQHDLNILGLVKNQFIMKKLVIENQQLSQKKDDFIQKIQKANDERDENSMLVDIQNLNLKINKNIIHNEVKNSQIFENQENTSRSSFLLIQNFIKSLDIGQITISLITNKGGGYRNKWNTIISLVVFCAVLGFLIFAGTFKLQQNQQIKAFLEGKDSISTKSIIINPEDIIFRANKTLTDKFIFEVKLINQFYQIIQDITLKSGSDCDSYVLNLNQTVGSGWLCLPKSITLKNNGKYSKTSLFVRFLFTSGLAITSTKMQVTYKQKNLINSQFVDNVVRIKESYTSYLKAYDIQLIVNQQEDFQHIWTSYSFNLLDQTVLKGLSFEMMADYQEFSVSTYTLWDIIDTSWGIFILTFTILLTKFTLYLNGKQRQKITSSNQTQVRNDISQILATYHKLKQNIFWRQLDQIKYFYKTKMENKQNKIQ